MKLFMKIITPPGVGELISPKMLSQSLIRRLTIISVEDQILSCFLIKHFFHLFLNEDEPICFFLLGHLIKSTLLKALLLQLPYSYSTTRWRKNTLNVFLKKSTTGCFASKLIFFSCNTKCIYGMLLFHTVTPIQI